mgnify:CR=1 FL=1
MKKTQAKTVYCTRVADCFPSVASDNVFSDGWTSQTPSMSGDVSSGFRAELTVAVPISG